jgi:hypothetical protein
VTDQRRRARDLRLKLREESLVVVVIIALLRVHHFVAGFVGFTSMPFN